MGSAEAGGAALGDGNRLSSGGGNWRAGEGRGPADAGDGSGHVARGGIEGIGRGDSVKAHKGHRFGLGCRDGGSGAVIGLCDREERQQESSGYRWEMHFDMGILRSLEVATVKVCG